jgi:hypothetical protein
MEAKAIKTALLAISAENIGNEHEAATAAYRAGQLAHLAGVRTSDLHSLGFAKAQLAWAYFVDGWYDAAEAV